MIGAFFEGITQSLLPCSWIILFTALVVGLTRPTARVMASFAAASVLFTWLAVAGWVVVHLALSGLLMMGGGILWWCRGPSTISVALVGAGAASAWQPCVGPALGTVLNQAQLDPIGALPGLAAFIVGVVLVGFAIGWGVAKMLRDRAPELRRRSVGIVSGLIGLSMLVGLYSDISSVLVSWSYKLWA
jgi:cytochrome c biogenesis protein CcdA